MPTPFHSDTFRRAAEQVHYSATMSGSAYAAADPHGHGDQATFDIRGAGGGGLRVTLARSFRIGELGNGIPVNIISDINESPAISYTADAGFAGTHQNITPFSTYKPLVDALTQVASSAYFGGAVSGDEVRNVHSHTAGGTPDQESVFRITLQRDSLLYLATAAPSDDAGSVLVRGQYQGLLPAGDRVWIKRVGSVDGYGSVELWVIAG